MVLSILLACGRPWINVCQVYDDHGTMENEKNEEGLHWCGSQGSSLGEGHGFGYDWEDQKEPVMCWSRHKSTLEQTAGAKAWQQE